MKVKDFLAQRIHQSKDILFDAKKDYAVKSAEWQRVRLDAIKIGAISEHKDWRYVRDVAWQNVKRGAVAKINKIAERGGNCRITLTDNEKYVYEILQFGVDSQSASENTTINLLEKKSSKDALENSLTEAEIFENDSNCDNTSIKIEPNEPSECGSAEYEKSVQKTSKKHNHQYHEPITVNNVTPFQETGTSNRLENLSPILIRKRKLSTDFEWEKQQIELEILKLKKQQLEIDVYKAQLDVLKKERELNIPKSKYTENIGKQEMLASNDAHFDRKVLVKKNR